MKRTTGFVFVPGGESREGFPVSLALYDIPLLLDFKRGEGEGEEEEEGEGGPEEWFELILRVAFLVGFFFFLLLFLFLLFCSN